MVAMDEKIIPKKLGKEPLIEAVCELRFKSDKNSISDLLPGLFFQKMGEKFPKVEKLPASNIPAIILKNDPNLRYVPTIKLTGDESCSMMIGEQVFSFSSTRPYMGWNRFLSMITELFGILKQTDLITHPERISLKYIDILESKDGFTLDALNLSLQIGEKRIITAPINLQTELETEGFKNIIQIAFPAHAELSPSQHYDGIMIIIDTLSQTIPIDLLSDQKGFLDRAHVLGKSIFFSLLKPETIKFLDPEY